MTILEEIIQNLTVARFVQGDMYCIRLSRRTKVYILCTRNDRDQLSGVDIETGQLWNNCENMLTFTQIKDVTHRPMQEYTLKNSHV
jgi:hypothetical protein